MPSPSANWLTGQHVSHVDVLIERLSGGVSTLQSYRNFGGVNWIRSLRLQPSSVETPIGSGTLTLHRQVGEQSLSPLVTGSPLNYDGVTFTPALDFGRELVVRACTMPTGLTATLTASRAIGATTLAVAATANRLGIGSTIHFEGLGTATVTAEALAGATSLTVAPLAVALDSGLTGAISAEPTEADWQGGLRFSGITDDPAWPSKDNPSVTVPFRDRSGALADKIVRTRYSIVSPSGTDAVVVMQEIVDVMMGVGQYTIEDLTTGGRFMVTEYVVEDISVWEALQNLALQWGGKALRQTEDPVTGDVTLAVISPPRDKVDADYSIGPDNYIEVSAMSTSGQNLRTVVKGRAVDRDTGELLTSQLPLEEDVETDPLVLLYGERFLGFSEDQASAIDTQAELDAEVAAIYADVSAPAWPVGVESKFAPFARVDDMIEWGANTLLWDVPLNGAVLQLTHNFPSPGVGRTTWECASKPKGAWSEWRKRSTDVTGFKRYPVLFSMDLTHTPVGTVVVDVDFNKAVTKWELYEALGASPVASGIPDPATSRGIFRPEIRTANVQVVNGTHYFAVRAFAGERVFAQLIDSIVITGVDEGGTGGGGGGGGGGGAGETPTISPATPSLVRTAISPGATKADWINTSADYPIDLDYQGDDEPMLSIDGLTAGTSTHSLSGITGPVVIKVAARYNDPVGGPGPWSAYSPSVAIPAPFP